MRTSTFAASFLVVLFSLIIPVYHVIRGSHPSFHITSPFSRLSNLAMSPLLSTSFSSSTSIHAVSLQEGAKVVSGYGDPVRALDGQTRNTSRALPRDLGRVLSSFELYPSFAEQVLQRKLERYAKQTLAQRTLSEKLGYPLHFEEARKGIKTNTQITEKIVQIARQKYGVGPGTLAGGADAELGTVSLAFGHLVRDWSSQGAEERQAVFPPVLDGLKQHFKGAGNGKKVLVPGSGLGRLASDIADLGYDVTANELDQSSLLAYELIANHTTSLHQHALQPFITKWTFQANPSSRYSTLMLPDHWPNKKVKLVEGDFLDMFAQDGEFDAIVTLFFIDISDNVIDFVDTIHRLLKPGGLWINLGPLKWGTHTALQLSTEEVLQLADLVGFDVDHTSRRSIDSQYASQPDTLLKYTYITQYWSATKRT